VKITFYKKIVFCRKVIFSTILKIFSLRNFKILVYGEPRSQETFSCTGGNYTTCGQCDCPDNKVGIMCECDLNSSTEKDLFLTCINPESPEGDKKECSGWGQCQCGKCHCQKFGGAREITGKFCECDSDVCHKDHNGQPCGGKDHGTCTCEGTLDLGLCEEY
jgi:hypothetical protein